MKKLLTISIPTFNRAKELDNQLAWLAKEIKEFEDDCEIIISDNCSNDDTRNVINKWQKVFNKTIFKSNRNSENIGWMKNFVYCVNAATSHYTWLVGDDDLIYEGTLAYVLEKLKKKPDLSLLYLNFSGRDKETDEVVGEHWFDTDLEEKDISDGKAIFQQCLEKNIGSVIFISATVFRTELARIALNKWPASVENWAGLAYWNGYCAAHGSVLVTKENYLECAMGVSYWQKDPKAWFGIRHRDIPEVYLKLQEIGYSRNFCRRNVLQILKEDLKGSELISNLKYYLWCFKDSPFWSMKVASFFIAAIGSVAFAITAPEINSDRVVTNTGFHSSYQEGGKVE